MSMGYRYGAAQEQAERRKARLAARYGTPPPPQETTITSVGGFDVMWIDDEPKPSDPMPPALPDTHRMPEGAPKKKGGRPKGSKNKAN